MKNITKQLFKFVKENWFKIALLIAIFWFLCTLNSGININIEIDHTGWIENESPWPAGLPRLPRL